MGGQLRRVDAVVNVGKIHLNLFPFSTRRADQDFVDAVHVVVAPRDDKNHAARRVRQGTDEVEVGVQDGDPFVTVIRGSFSNVVGLPIERLEILVQTYSSLTV